jgi:amino acid transporter
MPLAAGVLWLSSTLILVLLTLFGTLPVYRRVARESSRGGRRQSESLQERTSMDAETRVPTATADVAPDEGEPQPEVRDQVYLDDTGISWRQVVRGGLPGNQYIRVAPHPDFQRIGPGVITPRAELHEPHSPGGYVRRFLIGKPIPSASELLERVSVPRGLAIFASDNISSSAYATEEIMRVLILASAAALSLTMPITLAILTILAIVVISYRQVIRAYPNGGGSYVVAHENLGVLPGLTAGAALLTDYILTVAVSVSAGVTALTSAFPALYMRRVEIALVVVALMTIVNLRGITESGRIFTIPTYVYVVAMLGLIGYGLFRTVTGTLPDYTPPPAWLAAHEAAPLTLLLVLRAFASGSVALTGTEAVSNGVPSFKPPEVRNAQMTLVLMGLLFGTIFLGISFLAGQLAIVPDPEEVESVNSVLTRVLVGEGWFFYLIQFATALLLVLAANTAFNGFPRLASVLAQDGYLPRQFSYRGDRLAFTGGIVVLAVIAGVLIWLYEASVTGLIPLYTVGVFLAFTLSQAGLVRRWWTRRNEERGWQFLLVLNGAGALATGAVMLVVGISKFALGAWMVLVLIPLLVGMMWKINRHYRGLARAATGVAETPLHPETVRLRTIVPIADLTTPARQALAYAMATSDADHVVAVHITDDDEQAEPLRQAWEDSPYRRAQLVIIESPFRSLLSPLMAYIDAMHEAHPSDVITVVLPEYVPGHWWEHLLHNQTALRIKGALLFRRGVITANVPYHLRSD